MQHQFKSLKDDSPERRQLVALLLEKHGLAAPPSESVSAPDPVGPSFDMGSTGDNRKEEMRRFYNTVNTQLNSSIYGDSSYFLNLGYIPDATPQCSPIVLPDQILDKNSIKLVLETIGDVNLADSRILDVGCGRGGTIHVLNRYFRLRQIVGIDLSAAAIAFCNRHHPRENTSFIQGDAENIPLDDETMDAVINVESSHSYPNIFVFYEEVFRILKPDGLFLYADYFPDAKRVAAYSEFLRDLGFSTDRDQNVTSNVLLSSDEIAARRRTAFSEESDDDVLCNFLAVPGSAIYQNMRDAIAEFRILRLRKPADAGAS